MKVSNYPTNFNSERTTLIMGSFESFHNGHLKLIKYAKTLKLPLSIMLFTSLENMPKYNLKTFASLKTRLQWAANLGIDFASVIEFNANFKNTDGLVFLKEITKIVNAQNIVVGSDFAFGKNRNFKALDIKKDFKNTFIMDLEYTINDIKISTSHLKKMATIGEVELIRDNAAYPFTLEGSLVKLDFLSIKNLLIPHSAVYTGFLETENTKHHVMILIKLNEQIVIKFLGTKIPLNTANCFLSFDFKIRIIIKESQETITDEDLIDAKNYLIKK